jgi:DNA-binding NtrC family response regulator
MRLAAGNKKEVAEVLGVDRKTLYLKMDEYGWKGDHS